MAFRHARTRVRLWYRDREGTEAPVHLDFPTGLDKEAVIDEVNGTYAAAVNALSDCSLCETNIEFFFIEESATPATVATREEAGQRGAFFFETLPDQRYVFDVPAILPGLLLAPDDVVIDTTQSDVTDLVTAILANDAAPIVNPFSVRPTSLVTAYKRLVPIEDERPTG